MLRGGDGEEVGKRGGDRRTCLEMAGVTPWERTGVVLCH